MSKVFKKSRIKSIKNGKIKKYLIYAIGEILVVAAGIFLAIYFNNLKEENVNKKYISKVLKDVNAETKKYITNSVYFMEYNAKRDSLVHKILTNKVKRDDYNLVGDTHLNVLQTMIKFNFDSTPLENLNKRIDFLNEDEKKIYELLKVIKTFQGGYEFISENAIEILNDYKKFQKANHDWFYLIEDDSIATKKEFEYRLKSFEYKNFIRDYANYEVIYKSNSYTFFQAASFIMLFKVIQVQKEEVLKPRQIDSVFKSLNFKRLTKIKCDSVYKEKTKAYELFKDIDLYSMLYNGSNDTIVVKNENSLDIVSMIAPKRQSTVQIPRGTYLQVFINEKCVAKYKTQINSYLFYE